jgi:hypothetical protein
VLQRASAALLFEHVVNPAEASLFPRVFWCQSRACGTVVETLNCDALPNQKCRTCNDGQLAQLQWVRVHRGGLWQLLALRSE